MTSLDALDVDIGNIPSNVTAVFGNIAAMNGDEYVRCRRCGYGGCDVRVSGCGCTMHAVSVYIYLVVIFEWFKEWIGRFLREKDLLAKAWAQAHNPA